MQAYYVIMKLPGADNEEFLLMLPFVPNGRSNMISWLGARSDVPDYGKALNFIFSKSTVVFGPSQVEATINQDPEISAQRTLWGQQGSQVIMGNLLVVPIEDSLLYVQPLYLQSERDAAAAAQARDRVLPRPRAGRRQRQRHPGRGHEADARRGARRRVRRGRTAGQHLRPDARSAGPDGPAHRADHRRRRLERRGPEPHRAGQPASSRPSQKALRAGDFAEYGRQVEALQSTLRQLQALQQ